ncbi:hypothetical protein GCM10010440_56700 [Kitasatospora cinereorecta]
MAVDASDLDYRARTRSGCIPPELASRLLERGHVDVVEVQARRGEWFCTLAWARLAGAQGRQADALGVLAPYLATGWWRAVVATAELLEGWGRIEEAIVHARNHPGGADSYAASAIARLLADAGRAEEAVTVLRQHGHTDSRALAGYLIDLGRIDDALAVLQRPRPRRPTALAYGPWHDGRPF